MTDLATFAARLAATGADDILFCAACVGAAACHLGLRTIESTEDCLRAVVAATRRFEGGPGVMHGGWVAAIFHEVFGNGTRSGDLFAVTTALTVNFRRPVPVDSLLSIEMEVRTRADGSLATTGTMRPLESEIVLATAQGSFLPRDLTHFVQHQHRLAELAPAGRALPAMNEDV